MKSVIRKAALGAAVLLVWAGGTASAETVDVKVPFAFVVQGHTLPAGEYQLVRDVSNPSVVLIRGEKGHTAAMIAMTRPAAGHDPAGNTPALTFKRVENQYHLSDVWNSSTEGEEIVTP